MNALGPKWLLVLIRSLRTDGLSVSTRDFIDVLTAFASGVGVGSSERVEETLVGLLARSRDEAEAVRSRFRFLWSRRLLPGSEQLAEEISIEFETAARRRVSTTMSGSTFRRLVVPREEETEIHGEENANVQLVRLLRESLPDYTLPMDKKLEFRYPLGAQEISRISRESLSSHRQDADFRRIDVETTIDNFLEAGVPVPVSVLRPNRRESGLIAFIDTCSLMLPFSAFVDHCVAGIRTSTLRSALKIMYFDSDAVGFNYPPVLFNGRNSFKPVNIHRAMRHFRGQRALVFTATKKEQADFNREDFFVRFSDLLRKNRVNHIIIDAVRTENADTTTEYAGGPLYPMTARGLKTGLFRLAW